VSANNMGDSKKNEELLNSLILFGQQMLKKHGEFYPFGMYADAKGEIIATGQYTEEEQPKSEKIIDMLKGIFQLQSSKGNLMFAGISFDSTLKDSIDGMKDAIITMIENPSENYSLIATLPYRKNDEVYEYGELSFAKSDPKIFEKSSQN